MNNPRGAVLILSLWLIVFMAILSFAIGAMARQYLAVTSRFNARDELSLIARSGVQKAIAVLNSKDRSLSSIDSFKDRWASSEGDFKNIPVGLGSFSVLCESEGETAGSKTPAPKKGRSSRGCYGVTDEERKIHLNRVNSKEVLSRLFQNAAQLDRDLAETIAGSILDWKDEDDHEEASGAEKRYYDSLKPPYRPKNAGFATLEELLWVKGMTPSILRKVAPYLTLTGSGKINLNTASTQVLQAIGLSDFVAESIASYRAGTDRKSGTSDDRYFSKPLTAFDELNQFQEIPDKDKALFQNLLAGGFLVTGSEHFTIRSRARLNQSNREWMEIICVVHRYGEVKRWNEHYGTAV